MFLPHRCLGAALLVSLALASAGHAKPRLNRFGFQGMGFYVGGYAVTAPSGNIAGPASIRIRHPWDGRSATVTWKSTFYDEHGRHVVALHWNFRPDGVVVASSVDPRARKMASAGTFVLRGRSPVYFTATGIADPGVTASGYLRLIGGGALSAVVTVSGLPEGDVTYSFSGARPR